MKPWEKYGQGAAAPWEKYPSKAASRGERNNNPGNIEDRGQFNNVPGYLGSDGRFAKFETEQAGWQAFHSQLQRYMDGKTTGKPLTTVKDIIGTWSPQADPSNQSGSTNNYIQAVSTDLGVDAAEQLSPADIPRLAAAMSRVETGNSSFARKPWERYTSTGD